MSNQRQVKGISPLIAVILLIAFTLVVAGILAGWTTNFARERTTSISQCLDARVIIYSANYDSTNNEIKLVVYNNGKIPLNFKTILSFTDGGLEIDDTTEATEVPAGSVETFTLTRTDGFTNLKEITMQSNTCFGAQDFIEARNIKDLQ